MKAVLKTVLFGLLAAALALGVRWIYVQGADVMDSGGTMWYEDAMLEAKAMFTEKPDEVQLLAALLVEEPEESLLRREDGRFAVLRGEVLSDPAGELADRLEAAVSGYASGGEVLNIEVRADAVIFYTYYGNGGCAGFLYEKELGETAYFDYVEIVENWKLFYDIPR